MNAQLLQLLLSLGEVALMVGLCLLLFGRAAAPAPNIKAGTATNV